MRKPVRDWSEFGATPEPKASIEAGNLQTALSGFALRHLLDYRTQMRVYADDSLAGFGATLWLMGDTSGAATVWSRLCEEALKGRFTYSSTGTFQGGLLLWFASVWQKDEERHEVAAALLEKLLRKRQPFMGATFPSLLARLLRKEVELPAVQAAGRSETEQRMALFYAGVRALEAENVEATRTLWTQVNAPSHSQCELEYYLLVHERKLLVRNSR